MNDSFSDEYDYKTGCMGYAGCARGRAEPKEFAMQNADKALRQIADGSKKKINAVWIETSGCFGEVISLLNGQDPDILYLLQKLVNMDFFGSISGAEGEKAYEKIISVYNTEYILFVSGAIPVAADGLYTTIATYKGKAITAMEVIRDAAKNAKHIISIGTCACYGGPSAASPNPSKAEGVKDFLGRNDIIQIPGCPANPLWVLGTVGYLINYDNIDLDEDGRPVAFYGVTIHSICPKRKYFDNGIFAQKLGDPECMFKLGCKGPITKAYCPVSRWNNSYNWPIEDRTPCIGCVNKGFPDSMEPFTTP